MKFGTPVAITATGEKGRVTYHHLVHTTRNLREGISYWYWVTMESDGRTEYVSEWDLDR